MREKHKFSGTNQKPERHRPFGTGLVRHCPQGLFSPLFTFLRAIYFSARLDFSSSHYLPLGLRGWDRPLQQDLLSGAKAFALLFNTQQSIQFPILHFNSVHSWMNSTVSLEVWVVYHLHGQTGRSTVSANSEQNSRLVNFAPEWRLPFVRISSIYWKTAGKA